MPSVLHSQFSLAELRLLPVSLEMSEELSGRPVDGSVRQPRRLTRSAKSDVYFAQQELYCLIESRVLVFMSE
jgi:hypothetical protein